jgi:aspartate/methionine/tyrosine aminotransferase
MTPLARPLVEALPSSKIREVANAGMGVDGVIALWFGEPDKPTPAFIADAASRALRDGRTFYAPNRGLPELREEIARYMSRVHGRPVAVDRVTVTASGMSALNLVQQVLTDPGDNVVVTGPIWPNMLATIQLMGGEPRVVTLKFGNSGWRLDLDEFFARVDGRTRALLVNSPGNPTGWTMEREQQQAVLDFARKRGLWIIADEVYNRLAYGRPSAPSFIDIAEPEDRVISVNSFSKSWAMTGWRLGWLASPAALGPALEKCIEFHHSCAAEFSQVAGITAIRDGEPFIAEMVARYQAARDLAVDRLSEFPRVRVSRPEAAFYLFFPVEGMSDSLAFCKRAVTEARVGLAPGIAFGPEGEGFLRLCFASELPRLAEALDRLAPLLR